MKIEFWSIPNEDKVITGFYGTNLEQFQKRLKLSDVVARLGPDRDYAAVFIPGGHGPLIGLPFSKDVAAFDTDRPIISICHGPAAFLARRGGKRRQLSLCGLLDHGLP